MTDKKNSEAILHAYIYVLVWLFKKYSFRWFLNFSLECMLFMNNGYLLQIPIHVEIKECWDLLLLHWGRLKFPCMLKRVWWWWSGFSLSIAEASSGKSEELRYFWNFMATLYEKTDSKVKRPFVLKKYYLNYFIKSKNAFFCKLLTLLKFPTPEDRKDKSQIVNVDKHEKNIKKNYNRIR